MAEKIYIRYKSSRWADTFRERISGMLPEGVETVWVDADQPLEVQAEGLKDAAAVIAVPSEFPVELARLCPNLKLVQVVSAGYDRIDVAGLGELGVRVANNGGGNAPAVAEHTVALMVATYRKLHLQFQSVRERKWASGIRDRWFEQAHELTNKTVGIVGLGRIGREVAKRLQGWDCKLIYYDFVDVPREVEERLNVTRADLDDLLRQSDVVTLHVPLTKNTRGMIGRREFELMKPTAILINACRGPVVDEAALIEALREGKIAAAGLDVLEQEPTPPDNPLLDMDNVAITPHLAAMAQESFERSRRFAIENVLRVARGEEPQSVVLPE